MNLALDECRDGILIAFMKGVKRLQELVMPLSLISQGASIALQDKVHKPELWRQLGPATNIIVIICELPHTHIVNDFYNVESGRLLIQLCVFWGVFIITLESSSNIK
jgi:hypothetical protein